MDYEKAYKEALERAKKKVEESTAIYGKNCAATQLIQEVFPELREREEYDRILKGIIGKIDHDQTYGVSKAEMLSFLKPLLLSWKPSEEQMMKEAVDGTVHHYATVHYVSVDEVQLTERLKQFQDGDEVKVIIEKKLK